MNNVISFENNQEEITPEQKEEFRTLVQLLKLIERDGEAYHIAQKYDLDYEALDGEIALSPQVILLEFEGVDGASTRAIEFETFWTKFQDIVDLLQKNNHKLDRNFFATFVGQHGRLMNYVCETGRENLVFDPKYWVDREREMIATYYLMKQPFQTKFPLEKIRYELAGHEDRDCRFYQTKKALEDKGLSYSTVFQTGQTDKYDEAMHSAGMVPDKEDFLVEVSDGKSLLNDKTHIKNFGVWAKYFSCYGSCFTAEDLTFKYGEEKSFLENVIEAKMFDDVFNPSFWIDNLEEMHRLWDMVPEISRNAFPFLAAYTDAEDVSYHIELPLDETLTKDMLFIPLNQNEDKKKNVIPLGIPWVWENFFSIQELLRKKGTPLALKDLEVTSGMAEEPVYIKAVRFGGLKDLMSLVDPVRGQPLSFEFCTKETGTGTSLLKEAIARVELEVLFQPDKWVNNVKTMIDLWNHTPDGLAKENVKDFGSLVSMANALTVRHQAQKRQKRALTP